MSTIKATKEVTQAVSLKQIKNHKEVVKGDMIICHADYSYEDRLTLGKTYEVVDAVANPNGFIDRDFVTVMSDDLMSRVTAHITRFSKVVTNSN